MSSDDMRGDLVLQDINSGERFVLSRNETSYKCGRGKGNNIIITSLLASREHCIFIRANGGLNVLDLGSANGIYINGALQAPKVMASLNINDLIGLGVNKTDPVPEYSTLSPPEKFSVLRLLLLNTELVEVGDLTQQPVDVTARFTSENKRRQSRDSLEAQVPRKIPKLETHPSIPVVIDISDESLDEVIVPKETSAGKIVGESRVSPTKAKTSETVAAPKTKEVSRALQENNSEISFTTGSSTCLSTRDRNKLDGGHRNTNPLNATASSANSSGHGRKKSEDSDKDADTSNPKRATNACNASRGTKRPTDVDTNHCQKPAQSRRIDEPLATAKETNPGKPENSKDESARAEQSNSKKKLPSNHPPKKRNSSDAKTTLTKEKIARNRSKSKDFSDEAKTSSNSRAKESSERVESDSSNLKSEEFLVPPLDLDEVYLQDRVEGPGLQNPEQLPKYEPEMQITDGNEPNNEKLSDDRRTDPEMPSANSSTINQSVNNCEDEQLIKYEPELQISDEEYPIGERSRSSGSASFVVPTPIKLKRVKQEPKTRYSEFDVVVLSDDEDGVFPASQLFGDEEDEVEEKVQIKDEIEDDNRDMFEDRREEISETIVLSDSDDEDNPWYDRLLRSQLLNESRLSLNNSIKEEEEKAEAEKEIVAPLEDDDLFDEADRGEEAERMEEEDVLGAEEEEKLLGAEKQPLGAEEESDVSNEAGSPAENVDDFLEDEIYDLVFANKDNVTEKVVPDKSRTKGKKNRSNTIEKENIDDAVCKSPREKQSGRDSGATEKKTKSQKTLENKIHKKTSIEGRSTDEKHASEEKKAAKKKRLSEGKKSTEDKNLSADRRSSENRKSTEIKNLPTDRRSSEDKKSTEVKSDRRSSDKKVPSVDKHKRVSNEKIPPVEKSSVPKQKSLDREKSSAEKPKKKRQSEEKRRRSSEAKSSAPPESVVDKSELAEPKPKSPEASTSAPTSTKPNPAVILTKLDVTRKAVHLVDPPFLTNGAHRGVSCRVTTIDKSADKPGSPVASTSGVTDKSPARKLTTKEKNELKLQQRIEEKRQQREQQFRRIKYKWAAECLPAKKKPTTPPCSSKERKDLVMDRKEKLRQLAIEKKLQAEKDASPVKRIVAKAKAKVTMNSRNDFLVKELEEQTRLAVANAERMLAEFGGDDSEVATEKDKDAEARVNGEAPLAREEKSPSEKVPRVTVSAVKDVAEENMLANEYSEGKKDEEKAPEKPREIPVNGEIGQNSGAIPIPKKPSRAILIERSEVPNMIPERPAKPNATKKLGMVNGTGHVFGEPALKLPASSTLSTDPRIRFGKSGKSSLKENRATNGADEVERPKSKKRVSFNDLNTRVEIFQIDPGNNLKKCVSKDAPLQVNQFPRSTTNSKSKECCPKLEQFLVQIFRWNPVWLEEQKQLNGSPPVVDDKKLVPLLSKYTNYEDYYEVTSPLLALELWCGITRDYEAKTNQKGCFNFSIVNYSITLTTVPSTAVRVTTLMLEVVVSKREAENQAHPVYGDLVFFEYISNRKNKEGCQRWKVFAYVTNVRQKIITPMTFFNRDLLNFVKDPHTLLTYTVMTKPLDGTDIQTNKVSRLRTISYLRSNIRMIQALQNLPVSGLCSTILHPKIEDYQLPLPAVLPNYPLVTKDKLNLKQMEAVARVTEAAVARMPRVCLIQGPPGTGKTRVIVNLVTQILYGNKRFQNNKRLRTLVCAPSNAAIDEIVLRLLEIRKSFQKGNRFNMVRIGREEAMHPQVKEISVTELAVKDVKKTADNYMAPTFTRDSVEEEKRFLQARINALELEKSNANSRKDPLIQKQVIRKLADVQAKLHLLMNRQPADRLNTRELSRLQRAAENSLLKGADVIACTLTSCYTNQMESIFGGKDSISVCIVDEATQTSEAETLIPLMLGVKTLVLVGDTNQLPATVLSQKAKQFGLEQSLFARIQNSLDGEPNNPIILLDTQYRMSSPVASWPNKYFYAGALKNEADNTPFPVYGYKVLNLDSSQDDGKFTNTDEASFVAKLVYTIMTRSKLDHQSGVTRIGVITPYNFQKQMVIQKIRERISHVPEKVKKKIVHEVNTVDSFQGQEREIIIMSCVRSNGIGFLSDRQRLCVALTRAKHSVILCGNFRTFERDSMWKALLKDARERRAYINIKASAETEEIKSHVIR